MILRTVITCLLLTAFIPFCHGLESLKVVGLFKDKVILHIDGHRKILALGDRSIDGIELLESNSRSCVLLINGEQKHFEIDNYMSVNFKPNTSNLVLIPKDPKGMYRSEGLINGTQVDFLIDTGATTVAMNLEQAKQLQLDIDPNKAIQVQTASGNARAYPVTLNKITLKNVTVYDIPAVVVDSSAPKEILLGMSFLKHFRMHKKETGLELEKSF